VHGVDTPSKKPFGPIGRANQEAASRRYERDERYRAAHDRLAPYRVIARAVILARVAKRLTQRDLADMLGTTDSAISRIESGERAISLETLRKLGAALDIVFLVGSTDAAAAAALDPAPWLCPRRRSRPRPFGSVPPRVGEAGPGR
jgi:ribosome-binding protein aMBF1 (putative translation factor)